ncbi:hypothetical protein [Nocardia sp. NPDC024068]|uniref:hypothetical protein n=1 Tax=Nocardia sp. NPDC024068 TaxID=3157197 RepID=UPI0033E70D1F
MEFLRAERPGRPESRGTADPSFPEGACELPAAVWEVFTRRAAAAGQPPADYLRAELVALARRRTVEDSVLELSEALGGDPGRAGELDEIVAAVRYARGE